MAKVLPTLRALSPVRGESFHYRIATCQIDDLRLAASAFSSTYTEIEESGGSHLVVSCSSQIVMRSETSEVRLAVGKNAVLVSNLRRSVERTAGSAVIVGFDPAHLIRTCASMAGPDAKVAGMHDEMHLLDFARRPQLFGAFLQICAMVDVAQRQQGLAESLGLHDTLYRWMATALMEPESLPDDHHRAQAGGARLDILCDTIRGAHERPLTLTEMENIAGLSSRSLQYAFMARFDCSPMEWQRRERMNYARQRLLEIDADQTITAIAHYMGFSSSAAFVTQYKRYFGETPSEKRKHTL